MVRRPVLAWGLAMKAAGEERALSRELFPDSR